MRDIEVKPINPGDTVVFEGDASTAEFWDIEMDHDYVVKKHLFYNGETHFVFESGEEFPTCFFTKKS